MELYIFLSDEEIRGELTRIRSNSWNGRFCFGAECVEILLSNRFDENYLGFGKSKRACKFILLQLCLLVFIYSKLIKEEGIVVNI